MYACIHCNLMNKKHFGSTHPCILSRRIKPNCRWTDAAVDTIQLGKKKLREVWEYALDLSWTRCFPLFDYTIALCFRHWECAVRGNKCKGKPGNSCLRNFIVQGALVVPCSYLELINACIVWFSIDCQGGREKSKPWCFWGLFFQDGALLTLS